MHLQWPRICAQTTTYFRSVALRIYSECKMSMNCPGGKHYRRRRGGGIELGVGQIVTYQDPAVRGTSLWNNLSLKHHNTQKRALGDAVTMTCEWSAHF